MPAYTKWKKIVAKAKECCQKLAFQRRHCKSIVHPPAFGASYCSKGPVGHNMVWENMCVTHSRRQGGQGIFSQEFPSKHICQREAVGLKKNWTLLWKRFFQPPAWEHNWQFWAYGPVYLAVTAQSDQNGKIDTFDGGKSLFQYFLLMSSWYIAILYRPN